MRRALLLLALVPLLFAASASAADTVTISGKAYEFNHMDTPIPGATIRVRELPDAAATTDAQGDYVARRPRRHDRHPLHRAARGLQPGRPADLPHARAGHRQRELPDAGGSRVHRPAGTARRSVRSRQPPDGVRHRHDGLRPQRARRRLPDVLGPDPARRARRNLDRVPRDRRSDLLQRVGDPRPLEDLDLRGRRDHLDRSPHRHLPDRHAEPDGSIRQLPRHLRARPGHQREPAVGRLRAEPGGEGPSGRSRGGQRREGDGRTRQGRRRSRSR